MSNKVYLFWWNSEPNVGDYASYYIVRKLTKKKIVRKNPDLHLTTLIKRSVMAIGGLCKFPCLSEYLLPWQTVISSVGSILDFCNRNTIVWGTGAREEYSKNKATDIRAVRGKLTKDIVGKDDIPIGDPALLLPLFYNNVKETEYFVSIIPHFSEYDYFKKKYGDRYHVIDIRNDNLEYFVDQILSSKYIVSSSLHGLIISHAYGVPALWIKKGYIYSSEFKFYDYFSSVGIPQYSGFTDIDTFLKNELTISKTFESNIEKSKINYDLCHIQKELLDSFPIK